MTAARGSVWLQMPLPLPLPVHAGPVLVTAPQPLTLSCPGQTAAKIFSLSG